MGMFKRATKEQARLRLGIAAPSGGGKSYSGLRIATHLAQGGRIAAIDTERGSLSKYSNLFEFDVIELDSFEPQNYIDAIHAAEREGYAVVLIDSLSHAWMGKGGALEQVDQAALKNRCENRFTAWRQVTPQHDALVEAMLQSRCHIIATMRAKTEYVMEEYTDANGRKKTKPVKVGLAPVQRDGMEYEFDVMADMDVDHNLMVSKTRCPALDGKVFHKPGDDIARVLLEWLTDGMPPKEPDASKKTVEEPHGTFAVDLPGMPAAQTEAAPPEHPANSKGSAHQLLTAYANTIDKAVAAMGYDRSDVKDLIECRFGVKRFHDIPHDAACNLVREIQAIDKTHGYMLADMRMDAPDADEAALIDALHERLASLAALDCEGHPLRATANVWARWRTELAGEPAAKGR